MSANQNYIHIVQVDMSKLTALVTIEDKEVKLSDCFLETLNKWNIPFKESKEDKFGKPADLVIFRLFDKDKVLALHKSFMRHKVHAMRFKTERAS